MVQCNKGEQPWKKETSPVRANMKTFTWQVNQKNMWVMKTGDGAKIRNLLSSE